MPSLEYQDLRIDVSWGGDFHIRLRRLDVHYTKEQIAELIYPLLDAKEKALADVAPAPPSTPDAPTAETGG
jgi:hypothetical protein